MAILLLCKCSRGSIEGRGFSHGLGAGLKTAAGRRRAYLSHALVTKMLPISDMIAWHS
jgi:hypothetical protein